MKFWENGTRPLEIVTSNQWFIRYPPKDACCSGAELPGGPDFMRVRYENWVNGLKGDWNITRQRFFGVPFPAGTRSTTTAPSTTRPRSSPTRPRCPSTPPPTCRAGYARSSGTSPAASRPTPT